VYIEKNLPDLGVFILDFVDGFFVGGSILFLEDGMDEW
jgi:hypothetical protein